MKKKKLKIISTIIAFLLCFPIHFLYDKFPCFITSIFAPVNESIWEHMKILFTSIIFTGLFEKIYISQKQLDYHNIIFANYIGAILSIPIFLIIFLPIYSIIGENIFITIIIMLITIIIAEMITYKIMNKPEYNFENKTLIFIVITYIIFTVLTYYPLKNDLFIDTQTNTYGTNK